MSPILESMKGKLEQVRTVDLSGAVMSGLHSAKETMIGAEGSNLKTDLVNVPKDYAAAGWDVLKAGPLAVGEIVKGNPMGAVHELRTDMTDAMKKMVNIAFTPTRVAADVVKGAGEVVFEIPGALKNTTIGAWGCVTNGLKKITNITDGLTTGHGGSSVGDAGIKGPSVLESLLPKKTPKSPVH